MYLSVSVNWTVLSSETLYSWHVVNSVMNEDTGTWKRVLGFASGTAMNRRGDGRAQRRSERNTRQTRGRKRLHNDGDNINVTNNEPSTPPAPPTSTQQLSQEQNNDADVTVHHNSACLVS